MGLERAKASAALTLLGIVASFAMGCSSGTSREPVETLKAAITLPVVVSITFDDSINDIVVNTSDDGLSDLTTCTTARAAQSIALGECSRTRTRPAWSKHAPMFRRRLGPHGKR
jgi:hypothetical protein